MNEDAGPGVKSKASVRFIEKTAKIEYRKGLVKLEYS
jgi:hypothetical protein